MVQHWRTEHDRNRHRYRYREARCHTWPLAGWPAAAYRPGPRHRLYRDGPGLPDRREHWHGSADRPFPFSSRAGLLLHVAEPRGPADDFRTGLLLRDPATGRA